MFCRPLCLNYPAYCVVVSFTQTRSIIFLQVLGACMPSVMRGCSISVPHSFGCDCRSLWCGHRKMRLADFSNVDDTWRLVSTRVSCCEPGPRRYRSRLVVEDCPRRCVHNRAPAIGCGPRLPALPDRSLAPPPCWSGLPARTRQRSGFYRDSGSRGRADGSLPALSRSAHLFHLMDGPALIQEQSHETRIRAPWQPSATPTCAMRAKSECF